MFNVTVATLARQRGGPQTESDQLLYNMVISTYGTHYVTRVIVGATANIYTLIADSYSKQSSLDEMRSQVVRKTCFLFFCRRRVSGSHSISQSLIEKFDKNSRYFAEYRPAVRRMAGKTAWQ